MRSISIKAHEPCPRGWIYTFKTAIGAVVVNRLDEVIHTATNYADAELWANANYAAIDEPLTRTDATKKESKQGEESQLSLPLL